jgi:hypothetical protein
MAVAMTTASRPLDGGPHTYRACPGDAFELREPSRPIHRWDQGDRGCAAGTGPGPPDVAREWHGRRGMTMGSHMAATGISSAEG